MRRPAIIILMLAMLFPGVINAQKRKTGGKKPKKEEIVEDPRITQMLSAMQKIMFIDSMVVDKNDFVRHIPLSPDCGKLEQKDSLGQYTNELKDYRLTTVFNTEDSICQLMASDYIGNEWTKPVLADGFDDASVNFPYLMPDGTTLYFAQKGQKSIGGYDLFVTRYDAESGTYLRAENIGMPFSSEANDYLYAIDETNQLGYLVTDRRQPEGKVCIYVFIPNDSRRVYDQAAYSEQMIRSLARIDSISATWTNDETRRQALDRFMAAKLSSRQQEKAENQPSTELESLRHQIEVLGKALQLSRNYYARASESDRAALRHEILDGERELEALQMELKKKEKAYRNAQYQ